MCELSEKFLKLELAEDIFKNIKYVVTGEVHGKVLDLLKCGAAERMTYFSDLTTHLIVGKAPEELDLTDANDLYEKPAVAEKWVFMCASLKKLVDTKPYLYNPNKLFSNLVFCFSKVEDRNALWSMITYHGGEIHINLTNRCNYLVTISTDTPKYEKAASLNGKIKIVTPDWIVEAVSNRSFPDFSLFHPKLINWPKPPKPHESTAAITGFEPDNIENNIKNEEKSISDSTQALLEKLKQRMPWNQPSTPKTSSTTDPVAPPNVVAPSFLSKMQNNLPQSTRPSNQPLTPTSVPQQSAVSSAFSTIPQSPSVSQVPRSIVHHSPSTQNQASAFVQNQQQQQQPQQQPPLNVNRLLGQAQPRPAIPQIRGQINPNQLILIQQKLQLIQQQITQLISQGQNQPNQQLTPQQIHQLQQLRQNQLMLSQALQNHQQQIQLNQQNQQMQNTEMMQPQQQQQQNINQQQQIPANQNNFLKMQQLLQQKQQLLNQQAVRSSQQQQILQNQPNLTLQQQQQQQNFGQNQQDGIQQQKLFQPQMQNQQMSVQALNQQLSSQNLGQQLNQQQLNQQQTRQMQQTQHINQQLVQQSQQMSLAAQQPNQQLGQVHQQLGQQNQQNQQLVPTSQQMVTANHQMVAQNQQIGPPNQQIVPSNQQLMSQNPQIVPPNQQLMSQNQQIIPPNQQIGPNQQMVVPNQQIPHGQQMGLSNQLMNQQNQQMAQQNLQINAANQQLVQQNQQQLNQNQAMSQQMNIDQQGLMNHGMQQQQQLLNQQQQQLNQQMNPVMGQQVVRTQFAGQQGAGINQQNMINQQVINQQQAGLGNPQLLVSQQQQMPQQAQAQRGQIPQHLWQQQQQQQQQQGQMPGQQVIRHPGSLQQPVPRVQWSPGQQGAPAGMVPQRQFIQLDAHTHNQLQKMPPEQQAIFVANLKKQRQLQLAKQAQQRAGGHILIRGNVPPGLNTQQQVQWLQQQAKQQGIILPPNIQQNLVPAQQAPQAPVQHAPGLSPINQAPAAAQAPQFDQGQQQQQQQKQYRLMQLQQQREQAQKNFLAQQQAGAMPQQQGVVHPVAQPPPPPPADSTTNSQPLVPEAGMGHPLVVNAKTKTALANMLSIKLQSGGTSVGTPRPDSIPEPSAAGTLRLMTAQHNAALNSKPQEIMAMQQRRVINGPNGEIIKPPGPHLPLTPTNEPPKLQYCQKPPLPIQHNRVGPFYGHNPNLKLPPDLFLLGCIFVVVEIESFLEERLPGWQQKIEKHGGEIEKQYCSKVTHVLCETQRHGVVMQALRDSKRCVTILWLSDVMNRKQVLPPWTALHLPQIYLDVTPAAKHLISISGFEGSDRNRVKQMINYTGAKCTTYFSKHNTLLICAKAEGKKFEHAKKWGIPVVNVQWLTDVILGNFTALNQMDHQAYQTFSNPPNMSFDPKLVPNMMHAWKAPINISQESYERVKRAASPVVMPKAKKQKTEHTDENDNISEETPTNPDFKILFSQFCGDELKELEKMVKELGGMIAKDHAEFSHLIMPRLARTNKLFFAISRSAPILSDKWLRDSHSSKQFLPEAAFPIDTREFNEKFHVDIDKTLLTFNKDKLFEGKSFWITPSVFPNKRILSELVQSCGGAVERIRRSAAQIEASPGFSYFIITAKHDLHLVADLLKNKKDKQKVVCNVELIFSSILKQSIEVEPYAVSVM